MSLDINRVGSLLHIADLAKQWPSLQGLHDTAMAELHELSAKAKAELIAAQKVIADKIAADKAAAKAQADAVVAKEALDAKNAAAAKEKAAADAQAALAAKVKVDPAPKPLKPDPAFNNPPANLPDDANFDRRV